MPLRRIPLLFAWLFTLSGCLSASTTRFDSDFFQQPPEIREKDGAYHLRLYEPERDGTGYSLAYTEVHGNDIHVWVSVRHSSGSQPGRLISLGIPVSDQATPPSFLWKNPDGTLHPMKLRRA